MHDTLPSPAEVTAGPVPDVGPHRETVSAVLAGRDPRLLVIAGPCSVHDPEAALEYAGLLAGAAARYADDLVVVLRAYLEKPRSVTGWTGFLPDPGLDGKGDLATGVRLGRAFLLDAVATGLPLAYEFVDPMLAPYVADTVSWGAIGARTVASQPHRHLASWLPMPVGMKNCVSGRLGPAVDAIRAAGAGQVFPGVGPDGRVKVVRSMGNPDAHLVLRGGPVPNYDAASVAGAVDLLTAAGLPGRVVVDASHGNSGKDHHRQPGVVAEVARQVAAGGAGVVGVMGVMVESYLADGRQGEEVVPADRTLSRTDACLGWERTVPLLETLALAVRHRRP
ncbi:3-deoxy-7-phosphoheptulonate synthase [Amycolatopsis jejuensis]|uniref:3-deoxy-7-phosphoheptulonate synthase n=1 Tax=Amycolatopsis jejuensis TaxID=330084 RepID=UPI00052596CF|nr:3-deoxy-7-phosphoheptulonate synthase [Amycolatopsis jejuensis]